MSIHIHDLPEDLDPGQLSTLPGGYTADYAGPYQFLSVTVPGGQGATVDVY